MSARLATVIALNLRIEAELATRGEPNRLIEEARHAADLLELMLDQDKNLRELSLLLVKMIGDIPVVGTNEHIASAMRKVKMMIINPEGSA